MLDYTGDLTMPWRFDALQEVSTLDRTVLSNQVSLSVKSFERLLDSVGETCTKKCST